MRYLLAMLLGVSLTGCSDDETSPPPVDPGFQLVFSELPAALISVWAEGGEVWAVGGDPGDGPLVIHFDGSRWTKHTTGTTGALWWVHGFVGGPVFMGGEHGVIVRYQGGSFETLPTPASETVFGIWGPAADDVWAVGGAGITPSGGFIWHFDGTAWSVDPTAPADLATTSNVFKIWGRSSTERWVVGTRAMGKGFVLEGDGTSYRDVTPATARPLFTVHGNQARVVAVGGAFSGQILESGGEGFADVTPEGSLQMNGIFGRGDALWAAGVQGHVMRRASNGWERFETKLELFHDFHAVAIDEGGGVWAVGGQVAAFPLVDGMMIYRGPATIPTELP
jgi:hypothetical protein